MPGLLFSDYSGATRKIVRDDPRKGRFSEIPIVDISAYLDPDATDAARQKVIDDVKHACFEVGFLYIKGHGLAQHSMDSCFEMAKTYFSLPEEKKMECYFKKSRTFRGYEPQKGTDHPVGHLKQAFNFGYEPVLDPLNPSDDMEAFLKMRGAAADYNAWPDVPGFKETLAAYYSQVLVLGRTMIKIFACALDLPESFFDDAFKVPGVSCRILYYPPQSTDKKEEGIDAHSDIECFTFLLQGPGVTALQVLNKDGEWVECPPVPGTLVLNVGDSLCRWTNGKFKSTVHRVVNTSGDERFSMPIFFGAAYETMLQPIPSLVPSGEKPVFSTMSAGDYVMRRLARSRLGIKYDESQDINEVHRIMQEAGKNPNAKAY